ncbi:MAG TPA: hypothetical protein VGS03_06805, partial [Candidatus Polarisedimenticolia bacterium]|nr:hypothetical protein [Candidatus Polarisedimenticolia bacterium]
MRFSVGSGRTRAHGALLWVFVPWCVAAAAPVGAVVGSADSAPPRRTANVVLVTLDGVRVQELFGGMDPVIAESREKRSGIYDPERARRLFWRDTAAERRRALLPFFWDTLAPQGIVLGNPATNSRVTLRNPHG